MLNFMLKNFNLMLFMIMMLLSIFIGVNTMSIMYFWVSVEINMMSFIPFMLFNNKIYNDSFMKYFLIQSIGSSFMLFLGIFMYFYVIFMLLILIVMLMKLGMFPFFNWYMNILINLSWSNCMVLMTLQKILYFYFVSNLNNNYMFNNLNSYVYIYYLMIFMSGVVSVWVIFYSSSLKEILGGSSLNQMVWLMYNLFMSEMLWWYYYILYSVSIVGLLFIFNMNNLLVLKNLYSITNFIKFMVMILMLILLGAPPFIGFFMKSFSSYYLINELMIFMNYMMLILSIVYSYFYMKIILPLMMINKIYIQGEWSSVEKNLKIKMILWMFFLFMISYWVIM